MYFRLGGGTIKGVSKPGEIIFRIDDKAGARPEDSASPDGGTPPTDVTPSSP
jgi:hypothetical protein